MKKLLLVTLFSSFLVGCSDNANKQDSQSDKSGSGSITTDLYGKYAYVDNTDSIKMNGTLELSYLKSSNGSDIFSGKVDVDRTENNEPVNCILNGVLALIDSSTYQLSNPEGSSQNFNLLLKRSGDQITITSYSPVVGCEKNSDKALFHSYTKIN